MNRWMVFLLGIAMWASPSWARTPICDELTGGQRRLAETILATEYLYECCDDTISVCLTEQPTCSVARAFLPIDPITERLPEIRRHQVLPDDLGDDRARTTFEGLRQCFDGHPFPETRPDQLAVLLGPR